MIISSTSGLSSPPGETASSWRMHIAVAQMAYEKGLFSAAARNFLSAIATAKSLHLPDQDLSIGLVGLAKCYCELGNFKEAESLYSRVLEIDHSTLSAKCNTLAEDLHALAKVYLRTNRLGEAEALLQKAALMLTAVDPHCLQLAAVEKSLAYIYCQQGRLQDADRLINHALALADTRAGRQDKVFAEVLIVLALLEAKKGRMKEAEELIERAIASFELLTGGCHPELAKFLELAAEFFIHENVPSKVVELTNRARAMRMQIKLIDH